ncbi:356_t:CDS:2 [Entrophospora sp. SA101]|nr:356_t:CDS:2 [Entrophospora sp. SA101]
MSTSAHLQHLWWNCLGHKQLDWNTLLFKITIISLVIYDGVNIADSIYTYSDNIENPPYFPLFLTQIILGVSTLALSFLYAFLPALTLHTSKHNSSTKQHINAQSASADDFRDFNHSPVENALDLIVRNLLTLAISFPPPSKAINLIKKRIINRRMSSFIITDSTTIVAPRNDYSSTERTLSIKDSNNKCDVTVNVIINDNNETNEKFEF